MAIVRPFKGMRFTDAAGEIGEVCCPPYDIISESERKAYIKKNPHNIIRLELPKETKSPYKKAKAVLDEWLEEGTLDFDAEPCFYIYEERFTVENKEYSLKGLIGKVFLYEFERGIILPHENTLSKAKEDRFNLMKATACNFSQVYSLYQDPMGKIDKSIAKLTAREPDKTYTDKDGVTHNMWVVPRCTEVDKISANMAGKKLYIADGHHRYETAIRYRDYLRAEGIISEEGENEADYMMMMLVNMQSPGLVVFPTHRIIHSLKKFSITKTVEACQQYFTIATTKSRDTATAKLKAMYAAGEKGFLMYAGKKYYVMKLNNLEAMKEFLPDSSDALRNLDVSILHKLVLERIMGIDAENMANGINLTYTRDDAEATEAVDNGEANCSFILNPTRVEEIGDVATAGEKMPQKSTYFYPKLTTGMVMNKLDRPVEKPETAENPKAEYVEPEAEFMDMP